jgi:phage shock protein A
MSKETDRLFYQSIGNSIQENKDKIEKLEKKIIRLKNKNIKLKQQNEFLTKRENKLQTIEQMYKSGSVDLDKLRKIVLEEE